jgi:hypothetical protein
LTHDGLQLAVPPVEVLSVSSAPATQSANGSIDAAAKDLRRVICRKKFLFLSWPRSLPLTLILNADDYKAPRCSTSAISPTGLQVRVGVTLPAQPAYPK